MTNRTTALKALTAAGALVVLAACGSSGGSGGSTGGSTSSGGSTSAGTPVHGGKLTFAAVQDAQSMNKSTVFDNNSIWIFEQIFQQLYTVSADGKSVVPQLATSYKVSSDKKTYTFTLRQGVKFSNGQPMTSKDVKFSIDQTTKASQGWGFINTAIKSTSAPSPDTFVVHLKYPWAPLLADLSIFANGIIPDNYAGKSETAFYNAPIGTGPFKWDVWHKGQSLTLVKNPLYWQKGLPYLDSITWTDVPSDNTRQQQLQGGQAQIDQFPAWSTVTAAAEHAGRGHAPVQLDADQLPGLQRDAQAVPGRPRAPRDLAGASTGTRWSRRCCSATASRPTRCSRRRCRTTTRTPPAIQFNLAEAKKEMAQSSVPHGFSTSIVIPSGNSDYLTISTIVQSELKPLGINVKINQLDPNTENTQTQNLNYDMTLTLWTMDISDPDELATFAVDPKSGAKSFFTMYNNPTVVNAAHAGGEDPGHREAAAALQHAPDRRRQGRVHGLPVLLAVPLRDHDQRAWLLRHAAGQHAHGERLAEQVRT